MSEQGVPIDEVTARDHIQVRAKLVRRLGGANNALAWARIHYRADKDSRSAIEVDGLWWWQAAYGLVAEETGLTEKQARVAIDDLIAGGYLERRPGKGRAFLYRPLVTVREHLPSRADTEWGTSALHGSSIGPAGQMYLPLGAVTPLIDERDVKDTPVVPAVDARARRLELFEQVWRHWPRKDSKKKAVDRFLKFPAGEVLDVARAIVAHGDAHAQHTPTQFVPHLVTWLNQERWNDPLPQPRVSRGRQDDDLALIASYRGGEQHAVEG